MALIYCRKQIEIIYQINYGLLKIRRARSVIVLVELEINHELFHKIIPKRVPQDIENESLLLAVYIEEYIASETASQMTAFTVVYWYGSTKKNIYIFIFIYSQFKKRLFA